MNKLELNIRIDLDMQRLNIRNVIYNNYEYECKNLNEIGEIVQDFINEYIDEIK
jgi:hypothetical protein